MSLQIGAYGRVILEPEPTLEDIAAGKVTNFVFVSWHPVGREQFAATKRDAEHSHVNPLRIKKALLFSGALQPLSTIRLPNSSRGAVAKSAGPQGAGLGLVRDSPQAAPALEGIPFDWTTRFRDSHHRKAEASGWQTGCMREYSAGDVLRKSDLPDGAHWITAHPNGPNTKGTPLLIQETHKGSGAFHVVGGAGDKLNYLRTHPSTKSPDQAHQDAAERRKAKAKAQAKQERRKQDRAPGTDKQKQLARQDVDSARRLR